MLRTFVEDEPAFLQYLSGENTDCGHVVLRRFSAGNLGFFDFWPQLFPAKGRIRINSLKIH